MARKKTSTIRVNVKAQLSARLRDLRLEIFGEHGGPELARRLNLPARTWYNYETGVTVPAEVLLGFIEQTGANPDWLLTGHGPRFCRGDAGPSLDELTPQQLIRRSLEKLEQGTHAHAPIPHPGSGEALEYVSLDLVPWSDFSSPLLATSGSLGRVLVDRRWIAHPTQTVASRLEEDAMAPILPAGSILAVDRAVRDPARLAGRLVVACLNGQVMARRLELSGRHAIFRPNVPDRDHPIVPIELNVQVADLIVGQVVWSWCRFAED